MDGKDFDCNRLLGKIANPLLFLRQINIVSLNRRQAENILRCYGVKASTMTELQVSQLIVLSCREPVTAICKDGENNFRYILKPS